MDEASYRRYDDEDQYSAVLWPSYGNVDAKEPIERERDDEKHPLCPHCGHAVPMLWPRERTPLQQHAQRRTRVTCEDEFTFLYILTLFIPSFQLSYKI